MAWATVTYITGRLISHTDLNTLRDNLNLLAQHNHASSSGSGAGNGLIGPVQYITVIDAAAPGSVTGTQTILFTTAGQMGWVSGEPYVYGVATYGTPAAYYPGAAVNTFIAANTTHVHVAI